jgi:hypothetical protein
MMFYELWDIGTGNMVGSFSTEDDALAFVLSFGHGAGGREAIEHFMLGWIDGDDGGEIATGQALLTLAMERITPLAS